MAKSAIISNLESLFNEKGNKWVNQNSLVINYARGANLAVGGSIAMAISNKKPHKIPGDFDFFTDNNEDSLKFLQNIIFWLSKRPNTHYKVLINNKSEFTLPGVSHHVRIVVPFWKPVCIMTIEKPLRYFYYHGLRVQFFDDVVAAAKQTTALDGKDRLPFNVEEALKNNTEEVNSETTPIEEDNIPFRSIPLCQRDRGLAWEIDLDSLTFRFNEEEHIDNSIGGQLNHTTDHVIQLNPTRRCYS